MMHHAAIFKNAHGMLDEWNLIELGDLEDEQLAQLGTTRAHLQTICDALNIDSEHLYYDHGNQLYPTCYWDGLFYYAFLTLQPEVILGQHNATGDPLNGLYAKPFKQMKTVITDAVNHEDWAKLFNYVDKKVSLLVFTKLRNRIPIDQQKALFLEIYRRNEYGFHKLNQTMVRDILNQPTPDEYQIQHAIPDITESDIITIYRGVTPESAPLERAYSWTLDKNVAQFFANRFGTEGEILTATVRVGDIKAYMSSRSESEVLVLPEDVCHNHTK